MRVEDLSSEPKFTPQVTVWRSCLYHPAPWTQLPSPHSPEPPLEPLLSNFTDFPLCTGPRSCSDMAAWATLSPTPTEARRPRKWLSNSFCPPNSECGVLDTLEIDEEENGYHTPWDAKASSLSAAGRAGCLCHCLGTGLGHPCPPYLLGCHGELTGQTEVQCSQDALGTGQKW